MVDKPEKKPRPKLRSDSPKFRIKAKFRDRWKPQTPTQYEGMKGSIEKDGQQAPIIVWPDLKDPSILWIVDGHHRDRACKELGLTPKYIVLERDTEEEVLNWIYEHQTQRRNLTIFEQVEAFLQTPKYAEIQADAASRKAHHSFLSMAEATRSATRAESVNHIVGKQCGCSHDQVRRIKRILDSGIENLIKRVRVAEISVAEALRIIDGKVTGGWTALIGEAQDDIALNARLVKAGERHKRIASDVQQDLARALSGKAARYPSVPHAIRILKKLHLDIFDGLDSTLRLFEDRAKQQAWGDTAREATQSNKTKRPKLNLPRDTDKEPSGKE